MSHYAPFAHNTTPPQYTRSTPPRRPSAGVSHCDSVPLPSPPLSGTNTKFSPSPLTIPIGSTRRRSVGSMSFLWPWNNPIVDFDDREKMALVTDEKSDHLPKVSMKPWEGWRIVFLGSCRVVTILVKYRPLTIARAQHIASLLPCFGEYLEHTRLGFLRQFCSGSSNPDRRNLTHSSLLVREFANPLFSID